jgi:glutathione S-transferase
MFLASSDVFSSPLGYDSPMTGKLQLISFDICPYVERSRIAIHEKGLAYETTFIDLAHKPDWFLRISPMGKVPVLLVDERPIFESMVINELLEELHPAPALMPRSPLDRAEARAWIVFANDVVMPTGYKAQWALAREVPDEAETHKLLEQMRAAFTKLEAALSKSAGPWFLGDAFTLVDATYAPFFRRWPPAEAWHGTKLLAGFPRLVKYAHDLAARPSVIEADPGDIGSRLREMLLPRPAR